MNLHDGSSENPAAMSPRERIAAMYHEGAFEHADTFESAIAAHLERGYVLDTCDYFFMWRRVALDWPLPWMLDAFRVEPFSTTVWIWAVSGDYRAAAVEALKLCPDVELIGYERRGRPRLVMVARFLDSVDPNLRRADFVCA